MDRMSPLDATFVEAENEDRHVSMAIASIVIFEGPAPSHEDFIHAIEERLPLVPRYRQVMRTVPFRAGPPVWVDDRHFDIRYHIRAIGLPEPGGDAELAHLMAELMAQRLDRDRPLWEDWLVTGLAGGRWALISKVHHCMVDGVSGTDLYRVMFDAAPEVPATTPAMAPPAAPSPSAIGMLAGATRDALVLPVRGTASMARAARHPVRWSQQMAQVGRAMWKLGGAFPPAPPSSLSGPIGQPRRYTWTRVPLDDIRAIKNGLGGTVNDVVLAVITAGFRDLLVHRGETPAATMIPSLVPVSLRAPGEENIYENRVSAMIVDLPVHLSDPVQQLASIRTQMGDLKNTQEAAAGAAFVDLARFVPYPLVSLSRFGFRIPQREIVTVTTNVPGPRQTLYCLGRPAVSIIPYVPIASTVRIGVAIFSYRDEVTFGITGDYDTTPDLDVLAGGIAAGVARLLKAGVPDSRASAAGPRRPHRPRRQAQDRVGI